MVYRNMLLELIVDAEKSYGDEFPEDFFNIEDQLLAELMELC